jgi:hypothetical protein
MEFGSHQVDRISLSRDCVDLDPPTSGSDADVGCSKTGGFPKRRRLGYRKPQGDAPGTARPTLGWFR